VSTKNSKAILWALAGFYFFLMAGSLIIWHRSPVPLLLTLFFLWLIPFVREKLGLPPPDLSVYVLPPEIEKPVKRARKLSNAFIFGGVALYFMAVAADKALRWTIAQDLWLILVVGGTFALGLIFGLYAAYLQNGGILQNIRAKRRDANQPRDS